MVINMYLMLTGQAEVLLRQKGCWNLLCNWSLRGITMYGITLIVLHAPLAHHECRLRKQHSGLHLVLAANNLDDIEALLFYLVCLEQIRQRCCLSKESM